MLFLLSFPFVIIFVLRFDNHGSISRAFIDSAVLFSALTVVMTEFLSLFSAYNAINVLIFWILVCLLIGGYFRRRLKEAFKVTLSSVFTKRWLVLFAENEHVQDTISIKSKRKTKGNELKNFRFYLSFELVAIILIVVFALITLIAWLVFPNLVYDGLVFHLPRVFFWMQNESVHNFPTPVARQLYTAPFNAFSILQLYVLSNGSDYFLWLPQWFSYVGSIVISGLIAKELGLERKWQIISALLAATIPISILQAGTVQNDLMTALWVATTSYYVLRFIKDKQNEKWFELGVMIGLSVGLALLTKISSAPSLLPLAMLVLAFKLRTVKLLSFVRTSTVVFICIILMCLGFYVRNAIDLEGDFLASNAPEIEMIRVEAALPIRYRAVLITKNVLYHFGSPSEELSSTVDSIVNLVARTLRVPIDSERVGLHDFSTHNNWRSMSQEPNPQHFLLLFYAVFINLMYFIKQKRGLMSSEQNVHLAYLIVCLASLILTSGNFLFTPSTGRHLLIPLLISIPLITLSLRLLVQGNSIKTAYFVLLGTAMYARVGFSNSPTLVQYLIFLSLPLIVYTLFASNEGQIKPLVRSVNIVVQTAIFYVVLYGFMILASPIGSSPANNIRLFYNAVVQENYSRSDFWNNLYKGRNLVEGIEFMTKSLDVIEHYELTDIGIVNISVGRATYQILRHFTDRRFRVEYIIHVTHHQAGISYDFIPQAIFALRHQDMAEDNIAYQGRNYLPVSFSQARTPALYYVFLLEESYYRLLDVSSVNEGVN